MSLLSNLSAQCRHCGAVDALPADELGRMLEIKGRLALAEQRSLQVRGVDATLATIFEDRMAFVRVSGLYIVVALLVVAMASSQFVTLPNRDAIPLHLQLELIASQSVGPLMMLGVAFSLALALAYGRWHYQRSLRPLLLARMPAEPGARARCRVCGGDLPEARGVDVRCNYCRSVNLIPKALHALQASALAAEADALRAKLTGANVATMSIARRMRFAAIVFIALSLIVAYVLPVIVREGLKYVEF